MAFYLGVRPDVILFNRGLYTVSNKIVRRDGIKGKVKADPSYFVCTPYYYEVNGYQPYILFHSLNRDGTVRYDRDLLFTENLISDCVSADLYNVGLAASLCDDASEDLLSQIFDFWQGLKDTIDAMKTVGSAVSRIDAALPYVVQHNFKKAARIVTGRHVIANSWLEYNFAILPTIHTAQQAIQYAIKDRSQAFRMHKKRSQVLSGKRTDDSWNYSKVATLTCKYEGSASRYFTAAAMQQEFDRSAFTRPAPALWDAVPWSFAIDWFLPVGTWLDQMTRITQYASDGCDVRVCRFSGSYFFNNNQPYEAIEAGSRTESEDFQLYRVVNKALGAKTWDLQGLLSRSEFGINARRLSYLTAIVASKYRKSFAGGLL